MNEHNPDGVTHEQVGEGWRLLDEDENYSANILIREIEAWVPKDKKWDNLTWSGGSRFMTYRTRCTRDELAELRKAAK